MVARSVCVEMEELLAKAGAGEIKAPLAAGPAWDVGCGESGAEHMINAQLQY